MGISSGSDSRPGMPIIIPAWDIGVLSIKRSSQNQFNECRCRLWMMKSRFWSISGLPADLRDLYADLFARASFLSTHLGRLDSILPQATITKAGTAV